MAIKKKNKKISQSDVEKLFGTYTFYLVHNDGRKMIYENRSWVNPRNCVYYIEIDKHERKVYTYWVENENKYPSILFRKTQRLKRPWKIEFDLLDVIHKQVQLLRSEQDDN